MTPTEVQDLMLAFNKAVIERAMGAEMNMHLGYPPGHLIQVLGATCRRDPALSNGYASRSQDRTSSASTAPLRT
ncbi:transposase-like protein [Paraburkholderia sp. WSM4174]